MITPTFKAFTVFGERCSGTHFLIKLLERNVRDVPFTEDYGFKHWFRRPDCRIAPDCLVFVLARDPIHWAQSFHRKPWHAAPQLKTLTFSAFVRRPWVGGTGEFSDFKEHPRERCPETGTRFSDIWALREAKLSRWLLGLTPYQTHCAQYESVADSPRAFVKRVGDTYGLRLQPKFTPVSTYKGLATDRYTPRRYERVSNIDRQFISQRLNRPLERLFSGPGL